MRAGAPRNFFTVKYKSVFTGLLVLVIVITAFAVLPLPQVNAGTPYPTFSILYGGPLTQYCIGSAGTWNTVCDACNSSSPGVCSYPAVSGTYSVNIPSAGTFLLLAVAQTCSSIITAAPIVSDSINDKWNSLTSWNISASSSAATIWNGINYFYAYGMQATTDSITVTSQSGCIGGVVVWGAQGFGFGQLLTTSPAGSSAAASTNGQGISLPQSTTNSFSVSGSNYYVANIGLIGQTNNAVFVNGILETGEFCNTYYNQYNLNCDKVQNPILYQQSASFSFAGSGLWNNCQTGGTGGTQGCGIAYINLAIAFTANAGYSQGKQYVGNTGAITGASLASSSYVLSNAEQGTTATGSSLYIAFQPPSYWNQLTISNITVWLWGVKCAATGTPPTCTQSTFPVTIGLWYQQPNVNIPPLSNTPAQALTVDSCTYNLNNGTFAQPQAFTCSFPSPVSFYSTNGPYAIFLVISFTGSGTSPSYLYIDLASAKNYQPYLDNCASDGYNSYYIRCGTLQSAYPAIYAPVAYQTAGALTFVTSVFTSFTSTVTSTTTSTSTYSVVSSTTQTVQTTYTQVINQVLNFPNINTFQFWWFPLTIWLIFIGLFAALGRAANADGKTMILLILLGLEFGSIAGALMGTTPFIFSVIFAAMLGVVLWKVH